MPARRSSALALLLLTTAACIGEIDAPDSRLTGAQQARDSRAGSTGTAAQPGATDGDQTPGLRTGSVCPDGTPPLASGLTIKEIAIYQTVKSTLYRDGAFLADRAVPVVQGKQALVRVFVTRGRGYTPHAIRAQLTLRSAAGEGTVTDERTITADSTDESLDSTFSFRLDGAAIDANTELAVALEEPDCDARSGPATAARAPAEGRAALRAEAFGKLKVVIVPIRVNGRLPVTSEAELEKMRAYLLAYYPVSEIDLSVRAQPVTAPAVVGATDGRSWSNLLNTIMTTRNGDGADDDVYYYGMMQPAETARLYCARGCILGLAPQTVRVQPTAQIALGASFADEQTYETMVHELGHAHGRGHAPCAPGNLIDGVDSLFPATDGTIGTWGWDARNSKLLPPSYKDIMGYCQPNWISGYTYAALAERSQLVNVRAFIKQGLALRAPGATRWHQVILYADGTARWGGAVELDLPGGALEPGTVRDASGAAIADIEVSRIPLSDSGDAFVYLPEPGQAWSTVVIGDRVLSLSDIAPAE